MLLGFANEYNGGDAVSAVEILVVVVVDGGVLLDLSAAADLLEEW